MIESAWFCGECMNSSEFMTRAIIPKDGECDCCERSDNGKVWELGGITKHPSFADPSRLVTAEPDDCIKAAELKVNSDE